MSFRRQHPVGDYVANFCAPALNLIIEVDGGQHAGSSRDETHTRWLEAHPFHVVRFWNTDVMGNVKGVVGEIERGVREEKGKQKTTPT